MSQIHTMIGLSDRFVPVVPPAPYLSELDFEYEYGGGAPNTFYPFLEKGKPVIRVYKTLFLVAIVIQCMLLF